MSIADEQYVSLVTYKADGTAKPLPVWIVDLGDNTVGFTTWGESWKAKRVRANSAVTLQPCDQRVLRRARSAPPTSATTPAMAINADPHQTSMSAGRSDTSNDPSPSSVITRNTT